MKTNKVKIERGSGNVFADLGLPEAEAHLLKAELVTRIDKIIRQRGLKQVKAAKLLGLSQPDVSRLLRGSFEDFSMERLLRLLTALGRDVEIVIRESSSRRKGRLSVKSQMKKPHLGKDAISSKDECKEFLAELIRRAVEMEGVYQTLELFFFSDDNLELFNQWGHNFFQMFQMLSSEFIVNRLCSLTDKPEMGSNVNFSYKRLHQMLCGLEGSERLSSEFFERFDQLASGTEKKSEPVREFRNKHTSHMDADYTLKSKVVELLHGDLREATKVLYELLDHVQLELENASTAYDIPLFLAGTDGRRLLAALRLASEAKPDPS